MGIYVIDDDNIYVADYHNHRIRLCSANTKACSTVAGGNEAGNGTNQLN